MAWLCKATATDACICPGIERAGNPGLSPFQCTDLLCRLYEGSRDLEAFDGILFSAPIHMAKPDQEIYEYFFRKFDLNPSECFFIDDLEKNTQGAKDAGMDGIIFTGDIQAVKDAIDF